MTVDQMPEVDVAARANGHEADGEPVEIVDVSTPEAAAEWDAFVASRLPATGYHVYAWRRVFEDVFGHRSLYAMAKRGSAVVGILPLVVFRSPLFGRFAVSLPFVNAGGIVADDRDATLRLRERAGRLAAEYDLRHVELRHEVRRFPDLPVRQHKVSMRLPLPADSETLWRGFDRKVRNQVRKAEKSGLQVSSGSDELVDAFYGVFARNMRDLGTPVYDRRFFETIVGRFPDRARVHVVTLGREPVAASLTLRWRDVVEVPWASSLREHRDKSPNNLLYWDMLRHAVAGGCSTFDFGRSTPEEGTFHFKRQWGAEPGPMHWEYLQTSGELPDQGPTNPRFRLAIAAWQRLPLWITNRLGPVIVRGIP
jgi:FemAB-related protein (PEP-CTERM system-associated)